MTHERLRPLPAPPSLTMDLILSALVERLAPRIADELVARAPAADAPASPPLRPLVTRAQLAAHMSVSGVTVDRLVRHGMPHHYVADHRRFDIDVCLAWCNERGKVPAQPGAGDKKALTAKPATDGDVRRRTRSSRRGADHAA